MQGYDENDFDDRKEEPVEEVAESAINEVTTEPL